MSNDSESRALWREALGDDADATWDAFRMAEPPARAPLMPARRRPPWMGFGLAASWLAIAVLFAWNVDLQGDVTAARERTALVLLAAERSDRVLAGLADARRFDRNPAITAELLHVLKTSDDPNVQLEALDLLLDDVLKDTERRREVLDGIRFNRQFIERAIAAREIRT